MRKLVAAGLVAGAALALIGTPASAGSGPTVTADNYSFSPKTVTISAGQRVKWNDTKGTHTVTFRHSSYDKTISKGDTVSRKFKHPGTYKYVCTFHIQQGMKGKVIVN
jgi:plastocyanin